MNFGDAIAALKDEKRVAREGWNGKGMWICLMPAVTIPGVGVNARTRKFVPEGDLHVQPYIVLWTARGDWQPGWLASQADMLADDWAIVP